MPEGTTTLSAHCGLSQLPTCCLPCPALPRAPRPFCSGRERERSSAAHTSRVSWAPHCALSPPEHHLPVTTPTSFCPASYLKEKLALKNSPYSGFVYILVVLLNVCYKKCGAPAINILAKRTVPKSYQAPRAKYYRGSGCLLNFCIVCHFES